MDLIREASYITEGRPSAGMMGSIMLGRAIGHEGIIMLGFLAPVMRDMTPSQAFSFAEAARDAR
jgi:hypothetical protein